MPARWTARVARFFAPPGLSARLLALTILFVLLSEVLIYVPSVSNYRLTLLGQRLATAQLAALALEANGNQGVGVDLSEELLANAGVLSVVLKRNEQRSLFLKPGQLPPQPEQVYDLSRTGWLESLYDAFRLLVRGRDRVISIRSVPRLEGGLSIEAVLAEQPVRRALLAYSENVVVVSLIISIVTAALIFAAIHVLLVRPIKRLERSMAQFRQSPEGARAALPQRVRRDEIGMAERELAQMQAQLQAALHQRARLAALGLAVSKINHDLRNMLTSAQLFVDRLDASEDPLVRRLAPKLVKSIDRAVELASNTLRYGRAEEQAPRLTAVDLRHLAEDVGASAITKAETAVRFENRVPAGFELLADPEQLFRVLLDRQRNAAQAIEQGVRRGRSRDFRASRRRRCRDHRCRRHRPRLAHRRARAPSSSRSLPSRARGERLLGLAIAAELVKAHGGSSEVASTGPAGTVFP
ncbi:MAG: sensor histidine kinase [Alphaproteobacteria bacterium]